jgi:hypothetical protein
MVVSVKTVPEWNGMECSIADVLVNHYFHSFLLSTHLVDACPV